MLPRLSTLLLASTALATASQAQTYYSIDVTNDTLYRINVVNGNAILLGSLGVDVDGVDMAWHQGALYAKSFGTSNGTRIYQIVTSGMYAGYALPGAPLNGGGYLGAEVAGLASDGTTLCLTYSTQTPVSFYSTNIGTVNPLSGAITFVSTLSTDADAMCYVGGQFWTLDIINQWSGYDLYRGTPAPLSFVGNDTYDVTFATNPVDIDFFSAAKHVAVSQDGKNLVQVDRVTGLRGLITPLTGLPPTAVMKGLAFAPSPCRANPIPYH
jgi:hypothetical protein